MRFSIALAVFFAVILTGCKEDETECRNLASKAVACDAMVGVKGDVDVVTATCVESQRQDREHVRRVAEVVQKSCEQSRLLAEQCKQQHPRKIDGYKRFKFGMTRKQVRELHPCALHEVDAVAHPDHRNELECDNFNGHLRAKFAFKDDGTLYVISIGGISTEIERTAWIDEVKALGLERTLLPTDEDVARFDRDRGRGPPLITAYEYGVAQLILGSGPFVDSVELLVNFVDPAHIWSTRCAPVAG